MKKYLVHIIYLVIIAFFVVYANIKSNEAMKEAEHAAEQEYMVRQYEKELEKMVAIAEEEAAKAKLAENRAIQASEELKECKTQKK